jgi:hypothetical protein
MIHKKPEHQNKISMITTCMNRAHSIKKTLIHNINNLIDYKDSLEFVLINYDSKDDLEEYILNNCQQYIDSGLLSYYKLIENVEFFSRSRAKNIGHRLAKGNVVHNADAEWLMYKPIVELINAQFVTGEEKKTLHVGGNGGGIVNYKKHFIEAGGYDERMHEWGFEDSDLFNRLRIGLKFEHVRVPPSPYASNIHTRRPERNVNVPRPFFADNYKIHKENMANKKWVVNTDKPWGSGKLIHNFKEEISI